MVFQPLPCRNTWAGRTGNFGTVDSCLVRGHNKTTRGRCTIYFPSSASKSSMFTTGCGLPIQNRSYRKEFDSIWWICPIPEDNIIFFTDPNCFYHFCQVNLPLPLIAIPVIMWIYHLHHLIWKTTCQPSTQSQSHRRLVSGRWLATTRQMCHLWKVLTIKGGFQITGKAQWPGTKWPVPNTETPGGTDDLPITSWGDVWVH